MKVHEANRAKACWNCAVKENRNLADLQAASPAYQVRVSSERWPYGGVRDRMPRCLRIFRLHQMKTPTTAAMQRRAWGGELLIDTAVVREVVTGFFRIRFELEKWWRLGDLNPTVGDGIRSTCVYITTFPLRDQTYYVHFSKRAFYGSINKDEHPFVYCLTQKW